MECEIDLAKLRQITDAFFTHLINDLGVEKVTIKEETDFYWNVPSDRLYKVRDERPELDIGRLSDDWDFLKAILRDEEQAVALMLIHLAPILRYIGEEVGQ